MTSLGAFKHDIDALEVELVDSHFRAAVVEAQLRCLPFAVMTDL